jgi:endonuclease/exonuclease/phosphatase (EEP) superfamily protein YafD
VIQHLSPHAEFMIGVQKTSCAVKIDGIWFISVHGYNGFPFKNVEKLQDHIDSILKSLDDLTSPVVFAGDFNTWKDVHLDSVLKTCRKYGLIHNFKVKYDEKKILDHCFSRGVDHFLFLQRNFVSVEKLQPMA